MKKTVLLVDDDALGNTINSMILEKTNLVQRVESVCSGSDAVQLLENRIENNQPLPDLLLLDINMPLMDGFEFVKTIRNHFAIDHHKLDIIMLSSSFDPRDKIRTHELGIARYIEKPLSVPMATDALR